MSKIGTHDIRKLALSVISENPGGIRYSELVERIIGAHPETPKNTIHGSVWDLATRFPAQVVKPSRGLFKPAGAGDEERENERKTSATEKKTGRKVKEEDFYEAFADWLKNDLDEVTQVTPLGGAGLKGKWGTPDVVGVYKPLASHLVKFPLELVAAEIKIDPQATVVAFGQAVAYRLYSQRSHTWFCRARYRRKN